MGSGVGELASSPTPQGLKSLPSIAHFWVFLTQITWQVGEWGSRVGDTGVHRPSFQPGGGILVQRGVGVGFLAASQLISRPIFLRIHNTIMNRNSPTGNPSLVDMCSDL